MSRVYSRLLSTFALTTVATLSPMAGAATANGEGREDAGETGASNMVDYTLEELLDIDVDEAGVRSLFFFGFLRGNVERVFHIPAVDGAGSTEFDDDPLEWSFPGVHLYGMARPVKGVDVRLNIKGDEDGLEVREAFGNVKLSDGLQFRAGRMYRRFGLFNERLDQFPTFVGIEPPELFDKDHLLLPRQSLFAVHGERRVNEEYALHYRFETGNGEAGAENDVFPLGWDFRLKGNRLIVGTSGFTASLSSGDTAPGTALGDGPPEGGILPWMIDDDYRVYGAFAEYAWKRWLVQGAYWEADHDAERNPTDVLDVVLNAGINPAQRSRFLGANASLPDASLTTAHVVTSADYDVKTFYLRLGYRLPTTRGLLIPYLHIDWMDHPEVIRSKSFGGDNESGFADDGKFWKPSLGIVFKPNEHVAIKFDTSVHIQDFNGDTEYYPEFRFDISFAFKMFEGVLPGA